jgi:glucosamine--fructose-6-phosphate aminotransferase (isomerizing)
MCGIVAAVSGRNIVSVLVEGLRRLEYRGYDSCGVAVHQGSGLRRARSTARVAELAANVAAEHLAGGTGIAHTRWATHGAPVVHNAHPHFSHGPKRARLAAADDATENGEASGLAAVGRVGLVHNGIIENHDELRAELESKGYEFVTQTDTEVIAHLVDHFNDGDILEAVQRALPRLRGAYAIAVISRDEPQRVIGARQGSPLVLGVGTVAGASENFLASDAMALAGVTDQIVYFEEGDVVDLQIGKYWISHADAKGDFRRVERPVRTVIAHTGAPSWARIGTTCRRRSSSSRRRSPTRSTPSRASRPTCSATARIASSRRSTRSSSSPAERATTAARSRSTGSSRWPASRPSVEVASEYRYRDSVPNPRTLVVTISQSGETADTLAALKHARSLGMAHTLTVCNVATSAMVRECAMAYITRAGVEIGVASTKAFTTQLVGLFLLTLALASCAAGSTTPRKRST